MRDHRSEQTTRTHSQPKPPRQVTEAEETQHQSWADHTEPAPCAPPSRCQALVVPSLGRLISTLGGGGETPVASLTERTGHTRGPGTVCRLGARETEGLCGSRPHPDLPGPQFPDLPAPAGPYVRGGLDTDPGKCRHLVTRGLPSLAVTFLGPVCTQRHPTVSKSHQSWRWTDSVSGTPSFRQSDGAPASR